ncbi:MAG: glycosyltransferase family 2 protein [Ignavibacteria bacterium]|nr:glycosyltransferase family 2 protein [Ignavibacteria bacterium]
MTPQAGTSKDFPIVSVIIPHWKGKEILFRCLESLKALTYQPSEVLLIDNGSTDGSVGPASRKFPDVTVIRSESNLGYAGGCNLGLRHARGEFALLLNDDALVTEGLLEKLIITMQADQTIAACQPKILSIKEPGKFDYAGAAGGEMDRYGFPFCRGRMFDTCEEDSGQYDEPAEIFWASGACCLVRSSLVLDAGLFDTDFFAHMEEIDLQWRLRNRGYRSVSVPGAVARHDAGSTLSADTPLKVLLNHRNSLMMMIKNLPLPTLLAVMPVRMVLDSVAVVYRLLLFQPLNAFAILRSILQTLLQLPRTLRKRSPDLRRDVAQKALYPRSVVLQYFLFQRRTYADLPGTRVNFRG